MCRKWRERKKTETYGGAFRCDFAIRRCSKSEEIRFYDGMLWKDGK